MSQTHFTGRGAILWGVILNVVVLLSMISWDAYIFYRLLVLGRTQINIVPSGTYVFSEKDLDEVIKILNERSSEFERLSGSATVTRIKK